LKFLCSLQFASEGYHVIAIMVFSLMADELSAAFASVIYEFFKDPVSTAIAGCSQAYSVGLEMNCTTGLKMGWFFVYECQCGRLFFLALS
jgi:hypothetical protein